MEEKQEEAEEQQQQQLRGAGEVKMKKKKKNKEGKDEKKKGDEKTVTEARAGDLGKTQVPSRRETAATDRSSRGDRREGGRQGTTTATSCSSRRTEEEPEREEKKKQDGAEEEEEGRDNKQQQQQQQKKKKKSSSSVVGSSSVLGSSSSRTKRRRGSDSSTSSSSGGGREIDRLAINRAFAEVYEQRKRRELLQKNKDLLAAASSDESSSSSEEEDEDAELLSEKVEGKILSLLSKIKNRDACIYDSKVAFFSDDDFPRDDEDTGAEGGAAGNEEEKTKKKRPTTYADVVRETLSRHGAAAYVEQEEADEEEEKKNKGKAPTHAEEMEALKKAFLDAAREGEEKEKRNAEEAQQEKQRRKKKKSPPTGEDGDASAASTSEEEEDEEGGFLRKKKSSTQQEEGDFAPLPGKDPGSSADAVLQKYWAADEDLDADDRFLRDYILNQAWREDRPPVFPSAAPRFPSADDEDEEEADRICEEQTDLFEATYNFRYEEEARQEIRGHARRLDGSLRQKNEKRKRQRELKKARKEEEKMRRAEELKRLKNLKKEEIRERLRQIQQIAGLDGIDAKAIDLDADFDPATHDAEMGKIFGEDYEQQEEHVRPKELLKTPQGFEETLDTAAEANASLEQLTNKQKKLLQLQQKKKEKREKRRQRQQLEDGEEAYAPLRDGEAAAGADASTTTATTAEAATQRDEDEEEEGSAVGGGGKGEGKKKSEECEPEGEMDAPAEGEWWMCDGCGLGIPGGKKRFDCTTCENFTLCKTCFHAVRHPHHLVKRTVPRHCKPPVMTEQSSGAAAKSFDQLLDEYFQVDYEDVIGGDLPTRFKYTSVAANNYGMSTEEILSRTDKELNAKLSLKKLAPYRDSQLDSSRKIKRSQYMRRMQDENKHGARPGRTLPDDGGWSTMTRFGITKARLDAYTSKK